MLESWVLRPSLPPTHPRVAQQPASNTHTHTHEEGRRHHPSSISASTIRPHTHTHASGGGNHTRARADYRSLSFFSFSYRWRGVGEVDFPVQLPLQLHSRRHVQRRRRRVLLLLLPLVGGNWPWALLAWGAALPCSPGARAPHSRSGGDDGVSVSGACTTALCDACGATKNKKSKRPKNQGCPPRLSPRRVREKKSRDPRSRLNNKPRRVRRSDSDSKQTKPLTWTPRACKPQSNHRSSLLSP